MTSRPAAIPDAYRPHIDGLRAIAVLAVIANHFHHGLLPSGFLGVDIFFVISGYVVTSSLVGKTHATWKEYLLGFYVRRFKRLVPALAVSVLFTSLMTFLVIAPSRQVFRAGASSLIGMSNLYFLSHATDYFATAAELNPFTHTWSLGVEEQFYFVFPLLLGLCGFCVGRSPHARRNLLLAMAGLGVPSLLGYLWLGSANPPAAFFLMPARFWEFAAGCVLCVTAPGTSAGTPRPAWAGPMSLVALAAVIGSLFLPRSTQALSVPLIVAATCALLRLCEGVATAARLLSAPSMVGIGLLSYSLYLWHWPLLVLTRYVSGLNRWSVPAVIVLLIFLSWASYRLIETPLRRARWSSREPRVFGFALGGTLACFACLALVVPKVVPENRTYLAHLLRVPEPPRESFAFLGDCYRRDVDDPDERARKCLTASRSEAAPHAFYLLGDSHAQKMASVVLGAIAGTPYEFRFVIADRPSDFPYADGGRFESTPNLETVAEDARAGDVVALAFHRGHLNPVRDRHVSRREDAGPNRRFADMRANMDPFVKRLAGKGVRILFLRDVPLLGTITTVETCMMQEIFFGASTLCRVDRETDLRTRFRQDLMADELMRDHPGVTAWDPAPHMFKDGTFNAYDAERRYLMIDWHHISSHQESLLVAPFKEFLARESLLAEL